MKWGIVGCELRWVTILSSYREPKEVAMFGYLKEGKGGDLWIRKPGSIVCKLKQGGLVFKI
jgi:hypothetical protein